MIYWWRVKIITFSSAGLNLKLSYLSGHLQRGDFGSILFLMITAITGRIRNVIRDIKVYIRPLNVLSPPVPLLPGPISYITI